MSRARIIYIIASMLMLFSCARTTHNMKNNSWVTRTYHNTTSKYNIYFNGNEAYKEAVAKVEELNVDDYSRVLPIFEDGMHENFSGIVGDMDYAIEKANKIIQLHSIKKKPKYNPKKASDPEWREWRAQEEFNKMIDDAYMMMGKATFYKGEFLESIGIFNYVALKYAGEDAWYLAHLWMARAYAEMGWLYEAENMLSLVNDENLPYNLVKLYNIVSADFRIKRGEYAAAVPFLKSALEERFKKDKEQRYRFILAQIYQDLGQDALAYENYKRVARSIPEYEMDFFCRIKMTEVMLAEDSRQAIKKLNKMLKSPKNVDYQGQIYYALGNVYAADGDPQSAIENYRLSMEFSKDLQVGVTSTTIAELYYDDELYLGAQPYYATASETLPDDYPNISEIDYRAKVLQNLAEYYGVMGDVDRAYILSQMSESEKKAFLKEEEDNAKREEKIQELIAEANGEAEKELALVEDVQEVGDWYFYNPSLVAKGKEDFYDIWGDRPLRDNWRRSLAVNFDQEEDLYADEDEEQEDAVDSEENEIDSVEAIDEEEVVLAERLLKAETDKDIVDAYFNLAALYQYDIENNPKAIETYEALEAQYPNNPHSADSYFAIYNAANEEGDTDKAEEAKATLLRDYANSNYALILSDPNAKEILLADSKEYNILYESTFDLFLKGENRQVLANTHRLRDEFRDSTLMPKVLLMEALATAKVYPSEDIRPQLENIKANYAYDPEVLAQAEVILKQLGEGKKITVGGSAANTLSERRNKTAAIERQKLLEQQQFKYEPESRHYMIVVMVDSVGANRNQLQFDVSKFNFNKFMTMDFDLNFIKLNDDLSLMVVNGFSNEEEGKWYQTEFMSTAILDDYEGIQKMYIISEENFRLMMLLTTVEEYDAFDNKH